MTRHSYFTIIILIGFCHTILAGTFYIDPLNGSMTNDGNINSPWSTVEEVIAADLIQTQKYITPYNPSNPILIDINIGSPIQPGDTLILKSGLHGCLDLRNMHNLDYITLMGEAGAILKNIKIESGSLWRFINLDISYEPYTSFVPVLVDFQTHDWHGPLHDIVMRDCRIYSIANQEAWTIEDWNTKSSNGIRILGDHVEISSCQLTNINFGVSMIGDNIITKACIVKNFSGDGMRILGSNIIVEDNMIMNCYDVNDNHDDGIQSFNLGTYEVNHIIIRRNIILNFQDPNQVFRGPLQGIGCFDGPYNDWRIENNLVLVDHWHGISLYGAQNSYIVNNTVMDPSPQIIPGGSWIKIDPQKDGTASFNNVVANNVCNSIQLSGTYSESNNLVEDELDAYFELFTDHTSFDFSPAIFSPLIDAANDSLAPSMDINLLMRPQGFASDIGAYEHEVLSTTIQHEDRNHISLHPNPTFGFIYFEESVEDVEIYNVVGKVVHKHNGPIELLDLGFLPIGFYWLYAKNKQGVKLLKM